MKKIVVLTSGGDAPGMNACLRAIVRTGEEKGYEVTGVIGGYQGLIDGNFKLLTHKSVENIIHTGGTIIKTSRCDEFLTEEGFLKAVSNLKTNKIDALIVLGGDGSLKGAQRLQSAKINVVGIPCTIDNDLHYTDFTIGFDTAINTVSDLLNNVKETISSHDRVCVVEVMGRHSGEIALMAGTSVGAELVLCPEVKTSEVEILDKIRKSMSVGEKCVLVVVAEGFSTAENIANIIKSKLCVDARCVDFGYIQRGGSPSVRDRVLATKLGCTAIEFVSKAKFGVALGETNGKVVATNLSKLEGKPSKFDAKLHHLNNQLSI